MTRLSKTLLNNALSPYGPAFLSFIIFITAWLCPPALYSFYIGEQDLMFLHLSSLSFVVLCTAAFSLGVKLTEIRLYSETAKVSRLSSVRASVPLPVLTVPMIFGTTLCLISIVRLGSKVSNLFSLLSSQQGALVKVATFAGEMNDGAWRYVIFINMGVIWWSYWRSQEFRLRRSSALIYKTLLFFSISVGVITTIVEVDRTSLIPLLAGLVIVFLYRKIAIDKSSVSGILAYALIAATVIIFLFLFLSFLRGASASHRLIAELIGYTLTSYNRMAAELDGILKFPYGGRGIYLSSFVSFNSTLNNHFPINQIVGAPSKDFEHLSEFAAIGAVGLHSVYIWASVFGYVYSDLGWWTPVYFFVVGLIAGVTWRMFKKGKIGGIVLYPFVAFSILFWFGWNILFDTRLIVLIAVWGGLALYEYFFFPRSTNHNLLPESMLAHNRKFRLAS